MKNLICATLLVIVSVLASCTRENKASNPPVPIAGGTAGGVPSGVPPEITSATLLPAKATASTKLSVQYFGRSSGTIVNYLFRWYVDNVVVQEGPGDTLEPGRYKKGSRVHAEIIPSDVNGPGKPFATEPITIGNQPPSIATVSLSPSDPTVGIVITATPNGSDPDGDGVTYKYQWFVNGKAVMDLQDSNAFSTQGLHKKDKVNAGVTPSDGEAVGDIVASETVVISNSAPRITSTPNYNLSDGVYVYQIASHDPDGDRLTYRLLKAPQGMTINPSTGLIRWEVPKQVEGKQDVPIKISVDDGDGGSAYQEFSLTLDMK